MSTHFSRQNTYQSFFFFLTGFYYPYRTLAFLNGLLDPKTCGRTPWLGDQSNTRPLPKHRTTQHRKMQTHIHAQSRIWTCNLNIQAVVDSTCLRLLGYWDRHIPQLHYKFVRLVLWKKICNYLLCAWKKKKAVWNFNSSYSDGQK
jgi:hypothetical protein